MRAFLAIELPPEIKTFLSKLQNKLKAATEDVHPHTNWKNNIRYQPIGVGVKWVEPENIHLTLKFLGEINEEQLSRITQIMESVSQENSPYTIEISSLGAFPKIEAPRVLWVGAEKGSKETKGIAKALEEKIQKLGIPKEERAFSSHITIGRTRSAINRLKLIEELKKLEGYFSGKEQAFTVEKITLFKSTLSSRGPTYEVLQQTSLKVS